MLGDKITIKTPLRVSWDLSELPELKPESAALFPKVKGNFLFEFNLLVNGAALPGIMAECWQVLRKAAQETTLTVQKSFLPQAAAVVNQFPFNMVVVDWSDFDPAAFEFFAHLTGKKAVRFVLARKNFTKLGKLIKRCQETNVTTLILANPPLVAGEDNQDYLFDAASLRAVVVENQAALLQLALKCKIQVHDLFGEEIILGKPRRESNYAGCQAGLYLAYVNAAGQVYGCASLPVVIGELTKSTWEEIWLSPARLALRASIENLPHLCQDCETANHCKGGCRGISLVKYASFDCPDILCEVGGL